MQNLRQFKALTFDCYGTLIDWESGLLGALRPVPAAHHAALSDAEILERYARYEREAEAGDYKPYREILQSVARQILAESRIAPTPEEANCLVASFGDWPPFPDTVSALRALKERYRLYIVSNVDDDLFALTAKRLEVPFDDVITAEQAGSYKPSLNNFHIALERIGLPQSEVLHVAESLYHDIAAANQIGLASVWVNRNRGRGASGDAARADAKPDLEVPDLKTLVETIERSAP